MAYLYSALEYNFNQVLIFFNFLIYSNFCSFWQLDRKKPQIFTHSPSGVKLFRQDR